MKAITIVLLTFAASLSFAQSNFKPVNQEQLQDYATAIGLKNTPMNCHYYNTSFEKASKALPESIKPQDYIPSAATPYEITAWEIPKIIVNYPEVSITNQSLCFRMQTDKLASQQYAQVACVWFNSADEITGYALGRFAPVKMNAGTLAEPKIITGWKLGLVNTCRPVVSNSRSNTKTK